MTNLPVKRNGVIVALRMRRIAPSPATQAYIKARNAFTEHVTTCARCIVETNAHTFEHLRNDPHCNVGTALASIMDHRAIEL